MPSLQMRLPSFALATILAVGLIAGGSLRAQVRPIYSLGAAGLTQALLRLQTTASALHTAAHPDDEDSAFVARTARGDHARVAYLSLNRGEGGQNIIGPELFEALGVIRTEELLQARRLDGGEQFFTRTIDYGFSKTQAEAAAKWDEREVLRDMVRVIRMFRPLVIYSRMTGTPADGHGHHQLAGYLTPLAFRAAGDPSQFPEQLAEGLRPWEAKKLYRGVGFRPDPANPPTLNIQTGAIDPVIGRSYGEIASEGRSQHKSQQMGSIEPRGEQQSGVRLLQSLVRPPASEASIFDGIDTSLPGIARLAGLPDATLQNELGALAAAARRALDQYNALQPHSIIDTLLQGWRATRQARQALTTVPAPEAARAEADFLLALKEREFVDALTRAANVVVDPLAEAETMVPGESTTVTVRTFLPADTGVRVVRAEVKAPAGWGIVPAAAPKDGDKPFTNNPFTRPEIAAHSARYTVTVPAAARPTQPYFLEQPREDARYRWPETAPKALPFAPPLLTGEVTLDVRGEQLTVTHPVQYRVGDPIRGELRREVVVVPRVAVGLDSKLLIVPIGTGVNEQQVVVKATSYASTTVSGSLRLQLPKGWTSAPPDAPFTLSARGDQTSAPFVVRAPATRPSGTFEIVAEAVVDRETFARDMQVIAYPHIQTHRIYSPSSVTVRVFDLEVAPVRVGYVMGSGDQIPDALRRMGVTVTLIDAAMLATGDLSRFDTIVVGIRASEARPDFVANHARLMRWVEAGGTMIVQYQQNEYLARNLTPLPAQMSSRVTDETAPVKILVPDHPVFTFPNHISAADFEGWVQERNLYAFTTFDARYLPLLESADPGEPAQRGGQLYAEVGKGRYVYTAYAWFRQLPAGVPGAYRQFANLISLSKAPSR